MRLSPCACLAILLAPAVAAQGGAVRRVGAASAAPRGGLNVLAILREPSAAELDRVALPGFAFAGFDLLDVHGDVSGLTHCGGFDDVFAPDELNPLGLLNERGRAGAVRQELRTAYPDRPHAVCDVWALWRSADGGAVPTGE